MKVLALNGSPRKGGNTDVLLAAVVRGVEKAGSEVELVRLNDLDIQGCLNCGGCDETGVCILEDDMSPLYDKILSVKKFVIASPIYFYGVTAQARRRASGKTIRGGKAFSSPWAPPRGPSFLTALC
jgi:multimeric flavodoxin WrbA